MTAGAAGRSRARRWWALLTDRRSARLIGGTGVAVGLVVLAIRQAGWSNPLGVVVSVFTPYLVVVPLVATVIAAAGRQKVLSAAGVATVLLFGATQAPLYVGGPGVDGPHVALQVLTSNLRLGRVDAGDLVREIRERDIDVLMVQELTAEAAERLEAAGLGDLLPYALLRPGPGARGTGLYSRYALSAVDVPGYYENAVVAATLVLRQDGAAVRMTVASVHPRSPWPDFAEQWSAEISRMSAWADGLVGPVVIAGDFNATNDHRQMRRFFTAGYVDGAARAGGGYLATFPSDRPYPPLIAIDHVLTRGGPVTTSIASVTVSGTDHRAVAATVAVPY